MSPSPWEPQQAPLQVVDYDTTLQQIDATAAPEKQAKVALDNAIVSGNLQELQIVLKQIGQHIPHEAETLVMHAIRTAGRQGNVAMAQWLLEQISTWQPQVVFMILRYALDGAASQANPSILEFFFGFVQKAFSTTFPTQFLQLVQHAVNTCARQSNLTLLKMLMDHTRASSIPINYDEVFRQAASDGSAETLLKEAIAAGAQYESVILMLLQSAANLPENSDSSLGSRQSLKNAAKIQLIKIYKQKDPVLFVTLMTAVKHFFGEDSTYDRCPRAICNEAQQQAANLVMLSSSPKRPADAAAPPNVAPGWTPCEAGREDAGEPRHDKRRRLVSPTAGGM